ncbi:MAG: O-antigen ligase family protein, partial [Gammaproteobacteria bacterium]
MNRDNAPRIQETVPGYGSVVTALFIVSIYFSTFFAIVFSGLLGLLWLFSGRIRTLPATVRRHPAAAWSLLLLLTLLIGCGYGDTAQEEAVSVLKKYRELFFIPVLIPFFSSARYRVRAWTAVMAASVLSLLISYFMYFGFFNAASIQDPSLKSRITHSILMAYFAFFCLHRAVDNPRFVWGYSLLAAAAIINLFFIVEGRTGQLIFLVLVFLFGFQRFALKGRMATMLVMVAGLGLFMMYSNKAERINEGVSNTQEYLQDRGEKKVSSMGQRYTFWKYSIQLIAEKPIFGHGTGSFAREYQRIAEGERFLAQHPHNEFLFIGAQLGVLGLISYLGFLISQFYESRRLPMREKWLLQGLLAALVITSLFNSTFYVHTEGHWF